MRRGLGRKVRVAEAVTVEGGLAVRLARAVSMRRALARARSLALLCL